MSVNHNTSDGQQANGLARDPFFRTAGWLRKKLRRYEFGTRLIARFESREPLIYQLTLVLFCALALAFSVAPLANSIMGRANKDYDLWQRTGQIVTSGGSIYPTDPNRLFPFMYPPAAAVMLATIAELPRPLFVAVMLIVQTSAWAFCIYASVKLCTGRFRNAHPLLYMLPSICVIPFVSDMYLLGQPAILLLALALGAFLALRRKRPMLAGFLVSTAAAMKAYPIILIGYFIYRKQVRATAAIVAGVLFYLMFFPMAYRTTEQINQDVRLWSNGMLFKYDDRSIGQRPDRSFSYKNQSLQATVHRLSRPVLADGERDRQWRVNLGKLDFKQANLLMIASVLGIGLFTMWSWWGEGRPTLSQKDSANSEQAMSLMLTVMMAPLSFNYSYVWMIFPLTFLMSIILDSQRTDIQRRSAARTLAITIAFLTCSLISPRVAAAYGNIFFAGFTVFLGLGMWERRGTFRPSIAAAQLSKPHVGTARMPHAKRRDHASK